MDEQAACNCLGCQMKMEAHKLMLLADQAHHKIALLQNLSHERLKALEESERLRPPVFDTDI